MNNSIRGHLIHQQWPLYLQPRRQDGSYPLTDVAAGGGSGGGGEEAGGSSAEAMGSSRDGASGSGGGGAAAAIRRRAASIASVQAPNTDVDPAADAPNSSSSHTKDHRSTHSLIYMLTSMGHVRSVTSSTIHLNKPIWFNDLEAEDLTLWYVSIPIVPANKHRPILLNEFLESATELDPADDVSVVFPKAPPKKTIHIIVRRPPSGDLRVDIKRITDEFFVPGSDVT
ncbi:hypothetical protein KI688_003459 [Linnemannia hyalina]|uniref:Crinkler effector protein N-terminal domain-containing protein n=1 Tax=Linnemannia hyalina TaxID=64524 RepID=A0A9P8BQT2_9FUNG|nr:hypothetical protein KI688_003459 [Linnemannia hyalina]